MRHAGRDDVRGAAMTGRQAFETLTWQGVELLVFGLPLLVLLWASESIQPSQQVALGLLAGVYLVLGAVPFSRRRRLGLLAFAAFVVPIVIPVWMSWYFFPFERPDPWHNLPRVLFGPENLGVASLLAACAVVGRVLIARVWARARRRTTG